MRQNGCEHIAHSRFSVFLSISKAGFDTAAALQAQLLPLTDLLFCEVNPIPVKAAMKHIGYDCGICRLPLTPLTEGALEKMKVVLKENGII